MTAITILMLLLSIVLAAGLAFYQYLFKAGHKSKTHLLLAFLRFITIFGVLLLLINPKVTKSTYETEKTPLPVVVDNSASVIDLKADAAATEVFRKLTSDSRLKDKFDMQTYRFDSGFEPSESFDFKGRQTNLDEVAKNLKSINRNRKYPSVVITDGNQTEGSDYVYSFSPENKVYPIILGDTTTFLDLRVMQVNVNKYAFHKNKFPVEVFLQYSGNKSVNANFSITKGSTVLSRQQVSFSSSKRSEVVNLLLPADNVGLEVFKANLTSSESEKNTYNNTKNFAVEVIDQRTEIAIISSINHPDLGTLKRAIESNSQRKVTILKPNAANSLRDYNVLILYQPSAEFRQVFEANKSAGVNTFIITGDNTDFGFLNQQQSDLEFRMSSQKEDYIAAFDSGFNLFAIDDIGFASFPPLENTFGTVSVKGNANTLLGATIRNIDAGSPMLTFFENGGKRSAYLLGEGIWKWRLQSHIDNKSFEKFDIFADKIVQYLASDNSRKSLVVNHESFYNSGEAIAITAQFFNKNYEFDDKARLTITVTNKVTKQTKRYDLLKTNNSYKVNLDGLAAGQYNFSVRELGSNTNYNGYFEILDFDIEKQFVNPDVAKLSQLASQTSGKAYLPNQVDDLIQSLLSNTDYKSVEKEIVRKIPLIDSLLMLILIACSLAAEWFIRKYNGML
ncbi:hypothetical protein HUK80_03200 [Flavobacterium sp. MAH-1]|uniref:VWA domain-containing protein n=1 Tax=Flavobacterium agri TaxID=2743471 RepID=A0A7Y8XZQ8_9FLAO|nr:hypothetical protein [Flavobacterium agri]NUY79889.1 hypothetical protein [Flavobacterium agri]NYA69914.1 hypothetical protein [Flavobacterium agri]